MTDLDTTIRGPIDFYELEPVSAALNTPRRQPHQTAPIRIREIPGNFYLMIVVPAVILIAIMIIGMVSDGGNSTLLRGSIVSVLCLIAIISVLTPIKSSALANAAINKRNQTDTKEVEHLGRLHDLIELVSGSRGAEAATLAFGALFNAPDESGTVTVQDWVLSPLYPKVYATAISALTEAWTQHLRKTVQD